MATWDANCDATRSASVMPLNGPEPPSFFESEAGSGTAVRSTRITAAPSPDVEFFESTYPPGSISNAHGHFLKHEGYEVGTVTRGELTAADPAAAGRAVFDATARFHNPTHAPEWSDPSIDAAYEGVRSLVLRGLGTQVADGGS